MQVQTTTVLLYCDAYITHIHSTIATMKQGGVQQCVFVFSLCWNSILLYIECTSTLWLFQHHILKLKMGCMLRIRWDDCHTPLSLLLWACIQWSTYKRPNIFCNDKCSIETNLSQASGTSFVVQRLPTCLSSSSQQRYPSCRPVGEEDASDCEMWWRIPPWQCDLRVTAVSWGSFAPHGIPSRLSHRAQWNTDRKSQGFQSRVVAQFVPLHLFIYLFSRCSHPKQLTVQTYIYIEHSKIKDMHN